MVSVVRLVMANAAWKVNVQLAKGIVAPKVRHARGIVHVQKVHRVMVQGALKGDRRGQRIS